MNKIIITICTLCMLCISCMSTKVNYTIKGTANGLNGEKVYIRAVNDNKTLIDSTTVTNNSFKFKGSQSKACFVNLYCKRTFLTFILENGTIDLTINDSFNDSDKATGTPTNDILNALNNKLDEIGKKCIVLYQEMYALKEEQKDEKAALKNKIDKLNKERETIIKKCLNQNLNNILGAYLFNMIEGALTNEEFDEILVKASAVMKEQYYFKKAIKHHEALMRTEIGQKYTDFKSKDIDNKDVALSDYMKKGKYVLIEFWASWCNPCRMEIPYLKAAYKKYKSKGFEIVGVSLDEKKKEWVDCVEHNEIDWIQLSDLVGWNGEAPVLYGVYGVPSSFLIGPDGKIVAKNLRQKELEEKLQELIK